MKFNPDKLREDILENSFKNPERPAKGREVIDKLKEFGFKKQQHTVLCGVGRDPVYSFESDPYVFYEVDPYFEGISRYRGRVEISDIDSGSTYGSVEFYVDLSVDGSGEPSYEYHLGEPDWYNGAGSIEIEDVKRFLKRYFIKKVQSTSHTVFNTGLPRNTGDYKIKDTRVRKLYTGYPPSNYGESIDEYTWLNIDGDFQRANVIKSVEIRTERNHLGGKDEQVLNMFLV